MAEAAGGEKKKSGKGIAISILVVIGLGILPIGILGWGISSYFQSFREPRVETTGTTSGALTYPTDASDDEVTKAIDDYIKKTKSSSPLNGKGSVFMSAAKKWNVNPGFLLAIATKESSLATDWGAVLPEWYNYANITCNCTQGSPCDRKAGSKNRRYWEVYSSWDDAIDRSARYIRNHYLAKGKSTLPAIAAEYVGTDGAAEYVSVVGGFFNKILADYPVFVVADDPSLALTGVGPAIAGTYYPPYGPNMNKVTSYNTSPHGPKGHGAFPVRLASLMSSFTECKSCAVDYNITNNSMLPVYAAFDGKVAKAAISVHNSLGQYIGSVIYLISNDGTTGALYAHVKVLDGIKGGTTVKKGQVIAEVARRCKGNENPVTGQCTQFKSTDDHVHFQFYTNKTGLSQAALIKLFPKK